PEAGRNFLFAEIPVALGCASITERPVYAEIAARGCGIADERLVGEPPLLGSVSMGREGGIDLQAGDMKIIVRKHRTGVTANAACFADEQFQALLGVRADGVLLARYVAVKRSVAADQLAQVCLNGFAIVGENAVHDLFVRGAQALPVWFVCVG